MSEEKRTRKRMYSPKGAALWPRINTPDTKFDKDGKYSCDVLLDPTQADVKKFIGELEAMRDQFFDETQANLKANKKVADAKKMTKKDVVTPQYDDQGEETGLVILRAGCKASFISKKDDGARIHTKVELVDAKKKALDPKKVKLGGGSIVKVAVDAEPYMMASDKSVGVSLRLKAVQLIELKEWSGGGASGGFGDEDGYEADEDAAAGEENASGGKASGGEDDEF